MELLTEQEWLERLQRITDEAARKRMAKLMMREERKRARAYGLPIRHAAKLARNRRPPSTEPSTGPPTKEN
jgi:hypothetical protein